MTTTFSGSNDTLNEPAGASIYVIGNYDNVDMANGGYVNVNGFADNVTMSGGSLVMGSTNASLVGLTGSNNTVNMSAGSVLYEDGSNNTVSVSGTAGYVNFTGLGGDIVMSSGTLIVSDGLVGLNGSNNSVTVAAGNILYENGSNNNVSVTGSAGDIFFTGTSGDIVMSGGFLSEAASSSVILNGSNDSVTVAAGSTLSETGSGNTVTMNGAGGHVTLTGLGGDIIMSSGSLVISNGLVALNGSNDTAIVAAGSVLYEDGSNNIVTVSGTAGYVNFIGSGGNIAMSGGTLVLSSGLAGLSGSSNHVTVASGGLLESGNNDAVTFSGTGGNISFSGTGDNIVMSGGILSEGTNSSAVLNGSSNSSALAAGSTLSETGNADNVTVSGAGGHVNVSGSSGDVTMSGGTLVQNSGVGGLSGSSNNVTVAANSGLLLDGNGDIVTFSGTGGSLYYTGVGGSIAMSGGTLADEPNSSAILNGSNDSVTVSAGSTLTETGSSNTVTVNGTGGHVTLTGLGGDINMSSGSLVISNGLAALNGSSDSISVAAGSALYEDGNNNIVTVSGTAGYVSFIGTGGNIAMSSGTLVVSSGLAGLSGSNNHVTVASGGLLESGNSDVVTFAGAGGDIIVTGTSDNIVMSGGTISENAASSVTLTGSNNSVTVAAGSTLVETGGDNNIVVSGTTGGHITFNGLGGDVAMTSGTLMVGLSEGSVAGLTGSGNTVTVAAGSDLYESGNNNLVTVQGTAGYVNFDGSGGHISLSNGSLEVGDGAASVANLIGSNDIVVLDATSQISITGTNDIINGGTVVSESSSVLTVSKNTFLIGSSDTVNVTSTFVAMVEGNNDVVNVASASSVTLIAGGTGETMNMYGATLSAMSNDAVTLNGVYDEINGGAGDKVTLVAGDANDAVTMFGSTLNVSAGDTNIALDGVYDVVDGGSGSSVILVTGDANDAVTMIGGTLDVSSGVQNISLDGVYDIINIDAGSSVVLEGQNDVVNAAEGSTVTLTAGDSGDTINMYGGTVVIGSSSLSNIVINGTGDDIIGNGTVSGMISESANGTIVSSTATSFPVVGPIIPVQTNVNTIVAGSSAVITFTTSGYVPEVVYNAGNVQDLISYFEANPNLSEDQIAADESDSSYGSNLTNWLFGGANVYGSSSSLPSNVMAMLDGYSSLYTALLGIPSDDFSEAGYIEQQFDWAIKNAGSYFPEDDIQAILQNLMPTLTDTNAKTETDVSLAIECLTAGAADGPSNQDNIIIWDTAAKLLLEMAEQSDTAKTSTLSEEINLPDKTDTYNLAVTPGRPFGDSGSSDLVWSKNETGTVFDQILSALEEYVAPVVDVVSFIPGPQQPGFIIAAAALNLVQAGEDFADGADLPGVLTAFSAIGGVMGAVGKLDSFADLTNLGNEVSDGTEIAQSLYGVVNGAEEGNALAVITSALGGVSGEAALENDGSLAVFASIGASLGSATQDLGTGNIAAGLAALFNAAQTSGILNGAETTIADELNSLWVGFAQSVSGISSSATDADPTFGKTVLTPSPYPAGEAPDGPFPTSNGLWQYSTPVRNSQGTIVGIDVLDPTDTSDSFNASGNTPLIDGSNAIAADDGLNGSPITFLVIGHGDAQGISPFPGGIDYSPEQIENAMVGAGYKIGGNVEVIACNTALPNNALVQYNGNAKGVDFAQMLANLTGSSNLEAFNGFVIMNHFGSYIVNTSDLTNPPLGTTPGLYTSSSLNNASMVPFAAKSGL